VYDVMQQSSVPLSATSVGFTPTTAQVRVEREDLRQAEVPLKLSLRVRPPPLSRVQHRADTARQAVGLDEERAEEESIRRTVATAYALVTIERAIVERTAAYRSFLAEWDVQAAQALEEGVIDALQRLSVRRQLADVDGDLAANQLSLDANEALLRAVLRTETLRLDPWPEVAPAAPTVSESDLTALLAKQRVVRASRLPSLDFVEADISLDAVPEWGVTVGVGIPLPGRSRAQKQLRAASLRASRDLERRRVLTGSESDALNAQHAHWRGEERRANTESAEIRQFEASLPAGDTRRRKVATLLYEADRQALEARREQMLIESRWLSEAEVR
jgi:hypothetical protein